MKGQLIKIAGHCLMIDNSISLAGNYEPFRIGTQDDCPIISIISLGDVIFPFNACCNEKSYLDDAEELFISKDIDGSYNAVVKVRSTGKEYFLHATSAWDYITLSRNCISRDCPPSVIDKFIMLVFIYASSRYGTVLLHASSIKLGTDAVAFIGHSGAGKSTHSRLWLDNIDGAQLLNDDQPAIRVNAGNEIIIYGTPWSGKTCCYKSDSAVLRGIIRMKQAPYNKITSLTPVYLLRELLSSCSMMKSDNVTFKFITATLAKIASHVSGFILENKPDKDAVTLSYKNVFGKDFICNK